MTLRAKVFFFIITLFALIYNIFLPLHPDEAYYWMWSRHLDLSYFDGPPLIAYLIRIITNLFGTSVFTIKLTSVICITLTAYLVHQFAKSVFDKKIAETALILFLFLPLTQAFYLVSTPDSPLVLFWVATLYSFYLAINTNKARYFYLSGLCAGLLLLSKYTGVLLLSALFLYLLFSPQRRQFRNIHLYLAIILATILFSPVVIWNAQHEWAGFLFQWGHGAGNTSNGFSWKYFGNFIGGQLGIFNPIFFVCMIILFIKYRSEFLSNSKLYYLLWPFSVTFLFFFYHACTNKSEPNWTAPAYITAILILAYFIHTQQYRKTYVAGILLAILAIIFIKFPWTAPFLPKKSVILNQFTGYNQLVKQASRYYQPGDIVLSDSYQAASEAAFYLPERPQTYIISPHYRQPAYAFWMSASYSVIPPEHFFPGKKVPAPLNWWQTIIANIQGYFSKVDKTDPSNYYFWKYGDVPQLWKNVRTAQLQYVFWVNPPVSTMLPDYWYRMLGFQLSYSYWMNYQDRLSQYNYWSRDIENKIKQRKIRHAWYFGQDADKAQDLKIYFDDCEKTANLEYNSRFQNKIMVLYYCYVNQ